MKIVINKPTPAQFRELARLRAWATAAAAEYGNATRKAGHAHPLFGLAANQQQYSERGKLCLETDDSLAHYSFMCYLVTMATGQVPPNPLIF